ncbi:MAG: hypothetical protein ACLR78_12660 [Roseburia sp.]
MSGTTDDYVNLSPVQQRRWHRPGTASLRVRAAECWVRARGRGKDVILAPGINIKRSPLCGRNFEYMSEDPGSDRGTGCADGRRESRQSDVAACVKHFAANSQETERLWVDTNQSIETDTGRNLFSGISRGGSKGQRPCA